MNIYPQTAIHVSPDLIAVAEHACHRGCVVYPIQGLGYVMEGKPLLVGAAPDPTLAHAHSGHSTLQNLNWFSSLLEPIQSKVTDLEQSVKKGVVDLHNSLVTKDKAKKAASPVSSKPASFLTQWNHDVCKQFCQPVAASSPYVDQRCPNHCMQSNPTFKKLKDMDVPQARQDALEQLGYGQGGMEGGISTDPILILL